MGKELVCTVWFGLVAVAFLAPVLRLPLPSGALSALYALMLIGSALALVLPLARRKGKDSRVE